MPLALLALALPFANNIGIISRGETVGALLKEASAQTGTLMEAAPVAKGEIVIVSLKNVPADQFRTRLAEVVGGKWVREGDGWRLTRPVEMERAQAMAERKARVEATRQGVEKLKRQVAEQAAFDPASAKVLATKVNNLFVKYKGHLSDAQGLTASTALIPESPAGRLSIAALGTLSPDQIADVGPGDRIVYSTQPTRVQRKLPGNLTTALQRYVAEQNLYTKALQSISDTGDWATSYSPLLAQSTPEMPSSLLLATARSPYNDSLTVDVMLVGQDGRFIAKIRSLLNLEKAVSHQIPVKEGSVPLSERAQRFADALKQLSEGKTFIEEPTLIRQLESPEHNDPLSYVAADGLLELSKGENLIASIPDSGFVEPSFACMDPDGKLNLKKFSEWLGGKCAVKHEGGWLLATPLLPISTRAVRIDRGVMGSFFRSSRLNDGASLEGIVDYLSKVPTRYMDTISPYYAFLLLPDLNAAIDDRNIEMLRILGRMNGLQRRSVLAGSPFPVRQMSPASHADLNRLLYRADSPIGITTSGPSSEPGRYGSLWTEVTTALPNGVPEDGYFAVQMTEDEVVIGDGGSSPASGYRPMTAWTLGSMLARAENADPNDPRQKVEIDRYRYGRTRRFQFHLELTPSISMSGSLNENKIPRRQPSMPYEQLPQGFRDKVEKARAETRKQLPARKDRTTPP